MRHVVWTTRLRLLVTYLLQDLYTLNIGLQCIAAEQNHTREIAHVIRHGELLLIEMRLVDVLQDEQTAMDHRLSQFVFVPRRS